MASLVADTYMVKREIRGKCKIVADGGIRGYGDIIKALALGADYVMVGSVFSRMLESEGDIYCNGKVIEKSKVKYLGGGKFDCPGPLTKTFYGMASGMGQLSISGSHTKTSEGCVKTLEVKYTMESWVKNMKDYLRSSMSYIGITELKDMADKAKCIIASPATQKSINP